MSADDWTREPLGKLATLQRGFDLPSSRRQDGAFPIVSSGGVIGFHSEYKVKGPGVVTGRYGSVGEVFFVENDFWPLNTALWVKDFHGNHERFIFYLLSSLDFKKFSDKTGVPGVNRNDLHKIRVTRPPRDQQGAIAMLLMSWDKALEMTERMIKAKAVSHQALYRNILNRSYPRLQLRNFLRPVSRGISRPDQSYWALGIRSHGKGTFRRWIEDPNTVAMETLFQVRREDLIVNITFAWEGAVALVHESDEDCLVSHRFPTYEIDGSKALPDYLRHVIVQKRFIHDLGLISPGGAGRNRVLSKQDFLKLRIPLPGLSEQQRIADILSTSQAELALLQRKLAALQKQKRGLMQKLLTGKWRIKREWEEQ